MTIDKGILIRNIYYMLTYAFKELQQNNYEDIKGEEFSNIYDLFGEILYKATALQLKRGLHKEYVPHNDSLSTVKGKIDVPSTIALQMQKKLLIQCEFDEFSEDNLHNRIIKSTLNLLVRNRDIQPERRQGLRKLLLFFSNVQDCDLKKVRWKGIKYDRNSSTYRLIHTFCHFIVDGLLLSTESGHSAIQHFNDKQMARLFEKFVLNYYRKHYPQYNIGAPKVEWNIDREHSTLSILPEMQTDIMIRFLVRTLIIDTKYYAGSLQENMGKSSIRNNNINQIFTYIMNEDKNSSGLVDGMLLYAKTQEEITPDGQMTLLNGNRIYFRNLDLNQDFDGIKGQLDSFILPYIK